MTTPEYFHKLKQLAGQDLSAAHVEQHTTTATLIANIPGFPIPGVGTHSGCKPNDWLTIADNTITGRKHWLSNIPNSDWAVFNVRQKSEEIVVFVELKNVRSEMIQTLGMEATLTGHLDFNRNSIITICNTQHPKYLTIMKQHYLAFITNQYGLAESLFADINQYTTFAKINCDHEKQKIQLQLSVMKLLWESAINDTNLSTATSADWPEGNTLYAFSKNCLVDVIHFITEFTGSGLYNLEQPQHQRYRDALIYSSHMRNFYFSLKTLFA